MSTPTARELVAQRKSTELTTQSDNDVARYIDGVAPAGIAGRLIKYKGGVHCTADDGMPIDEHIEFAALCDQTLVGWLKFNEEGEAPERIQGLLYDGFRMPVRSELGDLDQAAWPEGLDGRRTDPWLHQISIVLQRLDTGELFTFSTTTTTGRRACGTLLRHYDRLRRDGALPIVRLTSGQFKHRDSRIGMVSVPVFCVVGKTGQDRVAKPTPAEALMDDEIPF